MSQYKRILLIGSVFVITVAALISYLRVEKSTVEEIPDPWRTATVPYESYCEGECLEQIREVADIESIHLKGVKIVMRQDINDSIAQLGDCLTSIIGCVNDRGDPAQTAACVAISQCPDSCRNAYEKRFKTSMPPVQQMEGLESIFLADDAVCLPRE